MTVTERFWDALDFQVPHITRVPGSPGIRKTSRVTVGEEIPSVPNGTCVWRFAKPENLGR
jgi:hypothetical protein